MKQIELMEIALKYIEKGYDGEDLRYGDDLYDATPEDKEQCIEYFYECKKIGTEAFAAKIAELSKTNTL